MWSKPYSALHEALCSARGTPGVVDMWKHQDVRARPGQIIDVNVGPTGRVHTFVDGTTKVYDDVIGGWTYYRTNYEDQQITNSRLDHAMRGTGPLLQSTVPQQRQCIGCGARSWRYGRCRYCGGDR